MVTINKNESFSGHASGIWFLDCSKLAINRKNGNNVTISSIKPSLFFWGCHTPLVKFSYCDNFHIYVITGSRVMIIFLYKEFTRNLEIGNKPAWVLPNIWQLGRVRETKFGTNISDKMLLGGTKCQGYRFYRFWVINTKSTEGGKTTHSMQIKDRIYNLFIILDTKR